MQARRRSFRPDPDSLEECLVVENNDFRHHSHSFGLFIRICCACDACEDGEHWIRLIARVSSFTLTPYPYRHQLKRLLTLAPNFRERQT